MSLTMETRRSKNAFKGKSAASIKNQIMTDFIKKSLSGEKFEEEMDFSQASSSNYALRKVRSDHVITMLERYQKEVDEAIRPLQQLKKDMTGFDCRATHYFMDGRSFLNLNYITIRFESYLIKLFK